jgi:ubiquinone biosynthesis protein COQ9
MAEAQEAFPRGAEDLVLHFSRRATEKALAAMEKQDMSAMRVRDRVTLGVRARLEALAPWKEAVRAGLKFMSLPPRGLRMTRAVWDAADAIWWAAGDTATDYNHYTKRGLLSGVITAVTLYWLRDTSDGHENTWRFLDRRIENVMTLGRALGKFSAKTQPQGRKKA